MGGLLFVVLLFSVCWCGYGDVGLATALLCFAFCVIV